MLTGGWMRTRMPNMLLFPGPDSRAFDSYMCNGNTSYPESDMFPLSKVPFCPKNYIHLSLDYVNESIFEHQIWNIDCNQGISALCHAIFASSNPYKCTRQRHQSAMDALSNGYAFSTLLLTLVVLIVSSVFSCIFAHHEDVEKAIYV